MTDKELLERAAKAAGLPELKGAGSRQHCYYVLDEQPTRWNPLIDDGDALRLAIKLGLLVETIRHQQTAVVRHKEKKICVKWCSLVESWTDGTDAEADDEYEAVRKAIVLAASEMGEKMTATTAPIAWMVYTLDGKSAFVTDNPKDFTQDHRALPLYTHLPQRKPLTNEELAALAIDEDGLPNSHFEFARAIEQAHGIGGEE